MPGISSVLHKYLPLLLLLLSPYFVLIIGHFKTFFPLREKNFSMSVKNGRVGERKTREVQAKGDYI